MLFLAKLLIVEYR